MTARFQPDDMPNIAVGLADDVLKNDKSATKKQFYSYLNGTTENNQKGNYMFQSKEFKFDHYIGITFSRNFQKNITIQIAKIKVLGVT